MRKRFILFNDPEFLVGRKAISDYLGMSWRTVLRWKKNYGMAGLFMRGMNGDPILIKSTFREWVFLCDEALRNKHPRFLNPEKETTATKDGQKSDISAG